MVSDRHAVANALRLYCSDRDEHSVGGIDVLYAVSYQYRKRSGKKAKVNVASEQEARCTVLIFVTYVLDFESGAYVQPTYSHWMTP